MCHAEATHTLEEVHAEFLVLFRLLLLILDLDNFRLVYEDILSLDAITSFNSVPGRESLF